jgi:hypothetical protein
LDLLRWFRAKDDADGADGSPTWSALPDFAQTVDDALRLLVYAAETGKSVDDATRASVLHAKAASNSGWDETISAGLLAALTKLADELRPVTAESLASSCGKQTKPAINSLRVWAGVLAIPIFVFSVLGFVTSSISTTIRNDITTANALLVKLRAELGSGKAPSKGTPDNPVLPEGLNEADVIADLQQYAATVRTIDARSRQLNWMVLDVEREPHADLRQRLENEEKEADKTSEYKDDTKKKSEYEDDKEKLKAMFQLPVGLPNKPQALDTITETYQDVRSFAQDVVDLVSVSYGAITTCLLPILYALLGTCAYLLRSFEEQLRSLTFAPSSRANWARFLIAGIGGAVVGLFQNFSITGGASVSPLAIAFLVGYAVDVFFSFLEGLMQSFAKPKTSPAPKPSPAGVHVRFD